MLGVLGSVLGADRYRNLPIVSSVNRDPPEFGVGTRALKSCRARNRSRSEQPSSPTSPTEAMGFTRRASHGTWPSEDEGRDPGDADRRQDQNGGLRGTGRQHELEEWDGIAPLLLKRAQRAVSAADDERHSFSHEERHARPQSRATPPGDHRSPDVAKGSELRAGPRRVEDPPGTRSRAERPPAGIAFAHHRLSDGSLPSRRLLACMTSDPYLSRLDRDWIICPGRGGRARAPTSAARSG
jgi:hypothetical protein